MPGPLAKGIIITVSVLVAAGIAAYENPQIREWIDKSRQKIALALHSLGEDIQPRPRSSRQDDPSTREEMTEMAEARRRRARQEIMERGRLMEEQRLRRSQTGTNAESSRQASFDPLVNEDGYLRKSPDHVGGDSTAAWATAIETQPMTASTLSNRNHQQGFDSSRPSLSAGNLHESVDSPLAFRQLAHPGTDSMFHQPGVVTDLDPFANQYEEEMRTAWNLPLPPQARPQTPTLYSSHASESLLDVTPTSENAPDPDFSIPTRSTSLAQAPVAGAQSEYFSAANSTISRSNAPHEEEHHLLDQQPALTPHLESSMSSSNSFYYAHPSQPQSALAPGQTLFDAQPQRDISSSHPASYMSMPIPLSMPASSAPSIADSVDHVHASDLDSDDDGVMSEFEDGIRTPASVWTDVGSVVSE